jgi:hypothetical protein
MGENEGQPAYACPVCTRKMTHTVSGGADAAAIDGAVRTRLAAIAAFAAAPARARVHAWAALGAWATAQAAKLA